MPLCIKLLLLGTLSLVDAIGLRVRVPGQGVLEGVHRDGVLQFLGIPYASQRRWQPPGSPPSWIDTRPASKFGPGCIGSGDGCEDHGTDTSEDCLFLNVYLADDQPPNRTLLPVMVFVHGGDYVFDCARMYPASSIVKSSSSVVVVTLNYRLGIFGFLGSSKLATKSHGTGNYGIQDQRAALQWVRKHIVLFGGDPSNVLLFGQSAGGNSVINHLTQTASFGLYHKVAIHSGTYHGNVMLAAAEKQFEDVLRQLGCTNVSCAITTDAVKVLNATGKGPWGPVVDGVSLKLDPWQVIRAGLHNTKVPVLIGSVRDEFTLPRNVTNVKESTFDSVVATVAPGKLRDVKALYNSSVYEYPIDRGPFNHWWWAGSRVLTDSGLGVCSVRRVARWLSAAGNPTYSFLYAHPGQTIWRGGAVCPWGQPFSVLGAHGPYPGNVVVNHFMDMPVLFQCGTGDDPAAPGDCTFSTQGESNLAEAMLGYWLRFAKVGSPNRPGVVEWPLFSLNNDTVLSFSAGTAGIVRRSGLRTHACDFWDRQQEAVEVAPASNADMVYV